MRARISEFQKAVQRVDWKALSGAYGPSDGSVRSTGRLMDGTSVETVLGNVPEALTLLATERDTESDEWADAMDVLCSHVSHQGDIYEVTPRVVPFIFDLLSMPEVAGPRGLAECLVLWAESAKRYEASAQPEDRALGRSLDAALALHAPEVAGWLGGDLEQEAVLVAAYSSRLRAPVLAAVQAQHRPSFSAYIAMTLIGEWPEWMHQRAAKALGCDDAMERLAAAAFIACSGRVPDDLLPQLDAILTPDAAAKLTAAFDRPLELKIPRLRAPWRGPLAEAAVIFAGPKLVVVRTTDNRSFTLHWPQAAVEKGARVRVGISAHGEPRVVEWEDGRETRRVELPDPADEDEP